MRKSSEEEREGVVKYHNEHLTQALSVSAVDLAALNQSRDLMRAHGLIGQDPARYHGLGFGNISLRQQHQRFIISATQSGELEHLDAASIACVLEVDHRHNRLRSQGLARPSSEAMSHGVIYQNCGQALAIIHVHCPLIWQQAQALQLRCTAADIAYGTVDMAAALAEASQGLEGQDVAVIAMLGHEDGVIAFGQDLFSIAQHLINLQLSARKLSE